MARGIASSIKRHRIAISSTTVVALLGITIVQFAFSSPGYAVHHPRLNDGGVWVVDARLGSIGRFNDPISELDGGFFATASGEEASLDVVQDGEAVVGIQKDSNDAFPVNTASDEPASTKATPFPPDAQYAMGGNSFAVLNPASGEVRAMAISPDAGVADLSSLDATAAKPLQPVVGKDSSLAIDGDGDIYVASSATGKIAVYRPTAAGFADGTVTPLGYLGPDTLQLTTVGTTVIAFDATSGVAFVPGRDSRLKFSSNDPLAKIQKSGPAAPSVVIATSTDLVSVPLNGSADIALVSNVQGKPINPVVTPDGCADGAWAGEDGVAAQSCDGQQPTVTVLKDSQGAAVALSDHAEYQTNYGFAVLNDPESGNVFTPDTGIQRANWRSVLPPPTQSSGKKDNNVANQGRPQPPKANPDSLGARPGQVSVLHVLDNDSSPSGGNLAINSTPLLPTQAGVTVQIAPDAQTIRLSLPTGLNSPVTFSYTITSDQGAASSPATVTVTPRPFSDPDKPPYIRDNYKHPALAVVAGSQLDIPVLADWRDPESDAVSLVSADHGATVTPDGEIEYRPGPNVSGVQTIHYAVSDGISPNNGTGEVQVTVLPQNSTQLVPPKAEPDIALATEYEPVTIYPLSNDIPGADPTDSSATLALAAAVAPVPGVDVYTDMQANSVTVTPQAKGTFLLPYAIRFGSQVASGVIRIDASQASGVPKPPVAMPDTAVIHGQNSAIVDVLANDYDPQGNVLVVQRATEISSNPPLNIAVIAGRFLDISLAGGEYTSGHAEVSYQVTDGTLSSAGQVSVTIVPTINAQVITNQDTTDVRSGDSVLIPVLQNDTDPNGGTLTLVPNSATFPTTTIGVVSTTGNYVRYAAPPNIYTATTVELHYYAESYNAGGGLSAQPARGDIFVHIHPVGRTLAETVAQDSPPTPVSLTNFAIAGAGPVKITIPTTGVDPDGDTVTVTGISPTSSGLLPSKGSVTAITPTSITYQAFPSSAGTDTFGYVVTDPYGKSAVGQISIAVVPPGAPQLPVAVDDVWNVAPGRPLHLFPESNDLYSLGDKLAFKLDAGQSGFTANTDEPTPEVELDKSPAKGSAVATYTLTDSTGTSNTASIIVSADPKFNNPPVAVDDIAPPGVTGAVDVVSVLKNDYDPDGTTLTDGLKVMACGGCTAYTSTTVSVALGAQPRTAWYEVEDAGGADAIGAVHVPAAGSGAPYLNPEAPAIQLASKTSIDIQQYAIDPAKKPVILTGYAISGRIVAEPKDAFTATASSNHTLVLTRLGSYDGPAAINVQVTDGASITSPGAQTAWITVPVQVGTPRPVLNCPSDALVPLIEGSPTTVTRDLSSFCYMYLPPGKSAASYTYTAKWLSKPSQVSYKFANGALSLQAASDAKPSTGRLQIQIDGFALQPSGNIIAVSVAEAPNLPLRPITLVGVQAGKTSHFSVSQFATSPLAAPTYYVRTFTENRQANPNNVVTTAHSGGTFSVHPGPNAYGPVTFAITATDEPSQPGRDVTTTVTANIAGHPAQPTGVTLTQDKQDGASISWAPLAYDGGAGAVTYDLTSSPATTQDPCIGSPCLVHNLVFGDTYSFTVTACNSLGCSLPSAAVSTLYEAAPPAPTNPLVTSNGDQSITLSWSEPALDDGHHYNQITGYEIVGQQVKPTAATIGPFTVQGRTTVTRTITGLTNDDEYTFQIESLATAQDPALASSVPATVTPLLSDGTYPQGPPLALSAAPMITGESPAGSTTSSVHITWAPADPDGNPAQVSYQVTEIASPGGQRVLSCADPTATSCDDTGLDDTGTRYTYAVAVINGSGPTPSAESQQSAPYQATGTPDAPTITSLTTGSTDGTMNLAFSLMRANGATASVSCTYSGASCGNWSGFDPNGDSASEPLSGLPQGQPVQITLVECNEKSCGDPAQQSQYTLGPPNPPTGGGCGLNGDTVTFSWSPPAASPGQRSITGYQIALDGGGYFGNGSTSYSQIFREDGVTHTLHVKSVDSNNEVGTPHDVSCADHAAPPPTPTVTVSQGAACGATCDPPGCAANNSCACTSSSCAFIHVVTSGFSSSVMCSFNSQHGNGGFVNESYDANDSKDSANFFGYPGNWVTATCGTVTSRQYTWP